MDATCGRCGRNIPDFLRVCEHCGHVVVESRPTILGLSLNAAETAQPLQGGFDFSPEVSSETQSTDKTVTVPPPDAEDLTAPGSVIHDTTALAGLRSQHRAVAFVTLACIASGAVTFGVLTARTTPPATVSAAVGAAEAAAAPASSAVFADAASWTSENSAMWSGGDRNSIAFEVASENTVGAWMRTVRPTLVVRCASGDIEAFVFTASASQLEPETNDHTVKVTFDGEREVSGHWRDSEEHDALFAPDGAAFVQQVLRARVVRFSFTPHNAAPAAAVFHVSGLRAHLEGAARQCGALK